MESFFGYLLKDPQSSEDWSYYFVSSIPFIMIDSCGSEVFLFVLNNEDTCLKRSIGLKSSCSNNDLTLLDPWTEGNSCCEFELS